MAERKLVRFSHTEGTLPSVNLGAQRGSFGLMFLENSPHESQDKHSGHTATFEKKSRGHQVG